jgi:predicted metalloprotease
MAHPALPTQDAVTSHKPAPASDPGATPVSPSHVRAVLTANTLYSQGGLTNTRCPVSDLGSASTSEQTRFYQLLMSCLSVEWRKPIESAGYRYTRPGLVVFDSPVSTPCGNAAPESGRTLAFYCPTDAVMYADVPQMRRFFGGLDVAYAVVIGHEFGHHVQSETGILRAYDDLASADSSNRVELSRRIELQASCMGGLFLGAVANSFPIDSRRLTELQQVAGSFGDEPGAAAAERDHGSGESNRRWIISGFDSNDIARCNTFTASSAEVN